MESISVRLPTSLVLLLLMLSGDVESNPGPSINDRPQFSELLKYIKNISSCSSSECYDFACILLNDAEAVKRIKKDNKEDDQFVRAVFRNWLERDDDDLSESAAAPRTWEALIECITKAELPGKYAKAIRDACTPPKTKPASHSEASHTSETEPANQSSSPGRKTSEIKAASCSSSSSEKKASEIKANTDSSLPAEKESSHTSIQQPKGKPLTADEDCDIQHAIVSDLPKATPRSFDVQRVIDAKSKARGFALIVTNENYLDSSEYSPLDFTESDCRAMEKTLTEFDFNCYFLKDLTGDEIREVLNQTSQCKYPDSYKYVVFVYSGHGDCTEDQKKSGVIGIDGPLIETTVAVVNPLKAIKPQSIIKMVFLDACRGSLFPPPVTKGKLTNCLVAYATQLGHYSFGTDNGSQWMIPLAEKLKQSEKSVQEVLREMKQEILENAVVQYPEIDASDCRRPVYLKGMIMTKGAAVPRVAKKPNIGDLASFARKNDSEDKGMIRIMDSVASATALVAKSLADLLLDSKDCPAQPESDQHKMKFVLEVMIKWLSKENPKVEHTWKDLIKCFNEAGLDEAVIKDMQDNLPYATQ